MKTFITITFAILLIAPAAQAQRELTPQACARVFTGAEACKNVRVAGDLIAGEVWDIGYAPGEEKFLGYAVRKSIASQGKELQLMIGIAPEGALTRVVVEDAVAPLAGTSSVLAEFLTQFNGKKAGDDFEIARQPEDLLYVPVMIKAMKNKIEMSETIARAVKEMLLTTQQMFLADARS